MKSSMEITEVPLDEPTKECPRPVQTYCVRWTQPGIDFHCTKVVDEEIANLLKVAIAAGRNERQAEFLNFIGAKPK